MNNSTDVKIVLMTTLTSTSTACQCLLIFLCVCFIIMCCGVLYLALYSAGLVLVNKDAIWDPEIGRTDFKMSDTG